MDRRSSKLLLLKELGLNQSMPNHQSNLVMIVTLAMWSGCIAAALLFVGCDTIGQDLKGVGDVFDPTSPSEAARDMFDQYDSDKRRQGTVLISNAPFGGTEVYVKQYRDMVNNERDPIVKATAIRALGKHGQPEDALRIIPHLSHETVQVRWEAAKALQRLHNPAAVTDLLKTLRNDEELADVRVASAVALGQYPEDRVVQGLVGALNARELAINTASQRSLTTLTGENFGLEAAAWLEWYNQALSSGTAFAGQQEYRYPTYQRDESIWEKMAFWSEKTFEQPAPPAGLRPETESRTYQDEAAPAVEGGR